MLFVVTVAIVCAVCVGSEDVVGILTDSGWRWSALAASTILPILVAACSVFWVPRPRDFSQRFESRCTWLLQLHALTWFGSAFTLVYVVAWPSYMRSFDLVVPLLDEALIMAPLILSWVASWAVLYAWYADETPLIGRWRFVWNQSRFTLLLALLPILLFCGLHDTIRYLQPNVPTTWVSIVVFAINLAVLITFFPVLLGWIWETSALPRGALHDRLVDISRGSGVAVDRVQVWNTDQRIANAAIAGILPATRRIYITDVLLSHFSDDEIEAAFAHEVGHARHHHALLRMVMLVVPPSILIGIQSFFHFAAPQAALPIACITSLAVIGSLGWYSRRMEHEADLWACQQLANRHGKRTALQTYLRVLFRLSDRRHLQRGSWLHPSHRARRRFLIRSLTQARHAASFQREMKWLAALVLALALTPWLAIIGSQLAG